MPRHEEECRSLWDATTRPSEQAGAATGTFLLKLLNTTPDDPPCDEQMLALQGGLEWIARRVVHAKRARVREIERAHAERLCVALSGVELPTAVCASIARLVPQPDRKSLAAVSRDWRAIAMSPTSWTSVAFQNETRLQVQSLLQRPCFGLVRAIELPRAQLATGFFASVCKACPHLLLWASAGGPTSTCSTGIEGRQCRGRTIRGCDGRALPPA